MRYYIKMTKKRPKNNQKFQKCRKRNAKRIEIVEKDPKLVEQLEYFRKLLSGLKRPGSKCPNA